MIALQKVLVSKKPWAAADKLRGNMDAAEYKHVVLRLLMEGKSYDDTTPLFPEV
jgi:type I restriction-modification system DNA methylase subunit